MGASGRFPPAADPTLKLLETNMGVSYFTSESGALFLAILLIKFKSMKKQVVPIEVPPELKSRVNNVKSRILFLSPSVLSGQEKECCRDDFESLANSNIGVGGFGKVYKVRHKVSQNIYAIKVISKAKIVEHDLVEQIKLEVQIMYKLNHPYVVKLYNHYEDDDSFYLILEYAPKGQIYTLLKKEGKFSERVCA